MLSSLSLVSFLYQPPCQLSPFYFTLLWATIAFLPSMLAFFRGSLTQIIKSHVPEWSDINTVFFINTISVSLDPPLLTSASKYTLLVLWHMLTRSCISFDSPFLLYHLDPELPRQVIFDYVWFSLIVLEAKVHPEGTCVVWNAWASVSPSSSVNMLSSSMESGNFCRSQEFTGNWGFKFVKHIWYLKIPFFSS